MDIELITGDKYMDFVIQNYQDIISLNELVYRTKIKLPEWVNQQVRDAILSQQNSIFLDHNIYCGFDDREEKEIRWFDREYYDSNSDTGIYMGTELDYDWDTLTTKSQENSRWLYLYFTTGDLKKKEATQRIDSWRKHLDDNKKELFSKDIRLGPLKDDPKNLAGYCLLNAVHIDIIREGNFPGLLIEAVKMFTKVLLPILRSYKK